MIEAVEVVSYGSAAGEALAKAVARAKAGRALAPVTVVVPSHLAGLSARRRLGSDGGIANVSFLTAPDLAGRLASDLMLDRPPLSGAHVGAAVRATLRSEPGPFAAVRDHAATEAAVTGLHVELAELDEATLDTLAEHGGANTRAAVALHRAILARLAGYHDDASAAVAAVKRPDVAERTEPLGHIVWHLPQPMPSSASAVLTALLAVHPSTVVVGATGSPAADAAVIDTCVRAGVAVPDPLTASPPPAASSIVSVTDADEEVRAVVRRIMELAENGVPFHRIGVFHPTPNPYVGLIEQHLAAAGIVANGPSRGRLHESVAGRTLLGALSLPATNWRRDRVMALVSSAPVRRDDGALALPTAWEEISREAGVVGGLGDWRSKLASHRARLEHSATTHPERPGTQHTIANTDLLLQFVEFLTAGVDSIRTATSWATRSDAALALLSSLLGPSRHHSAWPDAEQDAVARVEETLMRLATLDDIEPNATFEVFVQALRVELDVSQTRSGRFGQGVFYGPLDAAIGHELDAVFVLGCVEGLLPGARRDDALLPDADRLLTGGALRARSARLHDQHRAFLAALAAAPPDRRVLTVARSDLRNNRRTIPSRWLLDTASVLADRTIHSTDFDDLRAPIVDFVESFDVGFLTAVVHASLAERDLAAVATAVAAGRPATEHPAARPVARGIEAQQARRSDRFTEWDGNLHGLPVERAGDRPWSPTRLERWAACGMRYMFTDVFGLTDRNDPERVLDLDPLDRGQAVHRILELFIGEALGSEAPPPSRRWTDADRDRLLEIAGEVLSDLEQRGRTGRELNWELTGTMLAEALIAFLSQDDEHRATTGSQPVSVEYRFGREPVPPLVLTLPTGRTVAFSGSADRIDAAVEDPRRVFVSDYKTGKGDKYRALAADPVLGGTSLQLGIYAEAARQMSGATSVTSQYWIVYHEAVHRKQYGYEWTTARRERFDEVVAAIVEGIDNGTFPAVPGEWSTFRNTHENCTYCEFDRVCPRERGEQAAAKATAVELRVRDALAAPGGSS